MQRTWIILLDGAHCRIFQYCSDKSGLRLITNMEGDHRPSQEIASDDGGRAFDSFGPGRHRYESKYSQHERLKHKFVLSVMNELVECYRNEMFDSLVFVTPPHILGVVRDCLPKELEKLVEMEVGKDLIRSNIARTFNNLRPMLVP